MALIIPPTVNTEGQTFGPDSAVWLVRRLLDRIKYSKGFNLATGPIMGGKHVPLSAGDADNWAAIGMILTVPETVYPKDWVAFRTLVTQYTPQIDENYSVNLMQALYRYKGIESGVPTCELVFATPAAEISGTGWVEDRVTVPNGVELHPDEVYYLVYFYNTNHIGLLGSMGVYIESEPYLAFSASGLGDLSEPPQELAMVTESVQHVYGSIYSVEEVPLTKG